MKISAKGRYGLRAMLDLAVTTTESHVALNNIAERQNISVRFLEQVFTALRNAGLVKSTKGSQGGYTLSDLPSRITVGSILRALEGDLSVTSQNTDETLPGNGIEYCIKTNVWEKLNESINNLVDSITLEDLAVEHKKLNDNWSLMFYI
ncbi:MAG: Rrf2 family transcriptional regulator [Eubacteriales bacterium]